MYIHDHISSKGGRRVWLLVNCHIMTYFEWSKEKKCPSYIDMNQRVSIVQDMFKMFSEWETIVQRTSTIYLKRKKNQHFLDHYAHLAPWTSWKALARITGQAEILHRRCRHYRWLSIDKEFDWVGLGTPGMFSSSRSDASLIPSTKLRIHSWPGQLKSALLARKGHVAVQAPVRG